LVMTFLVILYPFIRFRNPSATITEPVS
jgi:hypothetical protein